MKRIIVILTFLTCQSFDAFSQDIIKLTDGQEIKSKIIEITDLEVKYRKFSNLNGPLYTKKKTEIANITYENGEKETIGSSEQVHKYTEAPSSKKTNNTTEAPRIINPPANDGVGIARVHKINGIDVYCMNTPLVKYSIVFSAGDLLSDADIKSIFFGGLARAATDDKMDKLVNAAYRKSKKEGKHFDALMYTGGNRPIAIKYEESNVVASPLAKVGKINGVELYAFCEPEKENYSIISEAKSKSGGLTSLATAGIVNSSIESDLEKLIDRLDSKKKKIHAVIYTTGKRGVGVTFN